MFKKGQVSIARASLSPAAGSGSSLRTVSDSSDTIAARHLRGQVSTEYLVILAVVLVVALIVVALVGGMSPVSTGVSESQSKNYWLGVAPVSISSWKYAGTSLDLTLQNMGGRKVTISEINVEGTNFLTNTSLTVGETKTVTITMGTSCGDVGTSFELQNVSIKYDKEGVANLIEKGDKSIVGKCS